MLDEMFQQNASKFAIFLEYENQFSFRATIFPPNECTAVHCLVYVEFSYSKNMANFKAFCWSISLSINLLFLKSSKRKFAMEIDDF